jgi:hypothetical protein
MIWCGYIFGGTVFPSNVSASLNSREDGPLKMFAKINDNAYNINLSKDYDVSLALKCL